MGAYYFSGDVENITINTRLNLLERKLSVRGNMGIQNNNLKDNKKSTTAKGKSASWIFRTNPPINMVFREITPTTASTKNPDAYP